MKKKEKKKKKRNCRTAHLRLLICSSRIEQKYNDVSGLVYHLFFFSSFPSLCSGENEAEEEEEEGKQQTNLISIEISRLFYPRLVLQPIRFKTMDLIRSDNRFYFSNK